MKFTERIDARPRRKSRKNFHVIEVTKEAQSGAKISRNLENKNKNIKIEYCSENAEQDGLFHEKRSWQNAPRNTQHNK